MAEVSVSEATWSITTRRRAASVPAASQAGRMYLRFGYRTTVLIGSLIAVVGTVRRGPRFA